MEKVDQEIDNLFTLYCLLKGMELETQLLLSF